jgi:hypothetical protein
MKPSGRPPVNYRPREGEQNGARIYQLILNSMQLLPVANISKVALMDNRIADIETPVKAKRKAREDAAVDPQPAKKKPATRAKRVTRTSKDTDTMEIA